MDKEEEARRDKRHDAAVMVIGVGFIVLFLLVGVELEHLHRHLVGRQARNQTLLLAYSGLGLLYLSLFTPRGYVERWNQRIRERGSRSRGMLPEWGWFGRILALGIGIWLTWWQGAELLAYLHL